MTAPLRFGRNTWGKEQAMAAANNLQRDDTVPVCYGNEQDVIFNDGVRPWTFVIPEGRLLALVLPCGLVMTLVLCWAVALDKVCFYYSSVDVSYW